MAENLMNSEHKATNEKYREGWDRIFGKKKIDPNEHFVAAVGQGLGEKFAEKYKIK